MPMIYVKAKEGRKAFYQGRIIPQDKFVPVTDDPYIQRLVHHWGDLEVEGGEQTPAARPQTTLKPQQVEKGPTPPVPGGGRQRLQPTGEQAPGTGAPRPSPPQAHND